MVSTQGCDDVDYPGYGGGYGYGYPTYAPWTFVRSRMGLRSSMGLRWLAPTIGITMAGGMVDGVMRDMVADGVMVVAVMPTPDTVGDTIAADNDLWRHRILRSYTIV